MIEIPLLRWGQPYDSLEKEPSSISRPVKSWRG